MLENDLAQTGTKVGGLFTLSRELSPQECDEIVTSWIEILGSEGGLVEWSVDRKRVRRDLLEKFIGDSTRAIAGWLDSRAINVNIYRGHAPNGITVPRIECNWQLAEDRIATGDDFARLATFAARNLPLVWGVASLRDLNAAPHARSIHGYHSARHPALASFLPGYYWIMVLSSPLAVELEKHVRVNDYPGAEVREIAGDCVLFRACADPNDLTPTLLEQLKSYFMPLLPPPGPYLPGGYPHPSLLAPSDFDFLSRVRDGLP